ncbi:MAG: dihydropteroate synthase [Candidatus Latescibacteria bacterium]|nr:dihydropteroate synthase [Candidatus Latescibacterota bacterium]
MRFAPDAAPDDHRSDARSRPRTLTHVFAHRSGEWDLRVEPRVVGILNLTPDSFYDGGRYGTPETALAYAERMVEAGADAIDIGGQSTRPGGTPVPPEEEWRRIEASLSLLAARVVIPLSIDTYHAEVARRALDAGVSIVNDVSGLEVDPSIADAAARAGAGLVVMHSLGAPADLHAPREYEDVAREIRDSLAERMSLAQSRGVSRERIALDPGIGFSKRADQSIEALRGIGRLLELERPIYVGLSRKSFLGALTGAPPQGRLAAGLGAAAAAYALGARVFRTHDVRETVECVRVARALFAPAPAGAAAVGSAAASVASEPPAGSASVGVAP